MLRRFLIIGSAIWILSGCNTKHPAPVSNIGKLIAFSDSIRNSKPDSAIRCYREIIGLIDKSESEKNKSQFLTDCYVGLANVYQNKGELDLASENDSIALDIAVKAKNTIGQAKALNLKGLLHFRLGAYDKAMDYYRAAMELATQVNDTLIQAKLCANMAIVCYYQGDKQKAIEDFKQALKLGKQINDGYLVAGNYLNLANVYNTLAKTDSVIGFTIKALDFYKKIGDKNDQILCYTNLGSIYYRISDYTNAITNFQLSLNLAIEMGNQPNIASGYLDLTEIYAHLGDNSTATSMLEKAIKIGEKLGGKINIGKGYFAVGNMYYAREDYDKASLYYSKALTLFLEQKNMEEIGHAYGCMANVYSGEHKSDSAIIYYNKAIDLRKQVDDRISLPNLYLNLGDEYRMKKEYRKAEEYFLLALHLKNEVDDKEGIALAKNFLANLYLSKSENKQGAELTGQLLKARQAGLESYILGKHLRTLPVMQEASKTLIAVFKKLKSYPEALEFAQIYNTLSDSILNKKKIEALIFAEARWNIDKSQQEIENLKKIQALDIKLLNQKETESRQQRTITWFILILFFVAVLLTSFVTIYIRRRRIAAYQKQLDQIAILRLQNTRNTLSPHFVFNILNNIWSIIDDREKAQVQFGNLVNLIRRSLINTDKIAIPLKDEIEFVKSFTELQKFRFDNELEVKWFIAPEVNINTLVPGMIIHIPVENAIKHALAPLTGKKLLEIELTINEDILVMTISDNGENSFSSVSPFRGTGTGLKVLTKTMHILNKKNERQMCYEITDRRDKGERGTAVTIKIPLQYCYDLTGITI